MSALVDSGADITVVPDALVADLDLRRTEIIAAGGFGGPPSEYAVFSLLIGVGGNEPAYARAISWDLDYVLLGRDVINAWRVVLDGPAGIVTIT